jgi:hypothetical protein
MHKNISVYTEDDVLLGEVIRILHRVGEVDPDLALYESYMNIWDITSGQRVYIPTDYIDEEQPDRIDLWIDLAEVKHEFWGRIPPFVAGRRYKVEELPVPA